MSTQVNLHIKMRDFQVPSEVLEREMETLRAILNLEVKKFLRERFGISPKHLIRGPEIVFLAD